MADLNLRWKWLCVVCCCAADAPVHPSAHHYKRNWAKSSTSVFSFLAILKISEKTLKGVSFKTTLLNFWLEKLFCGVFSRVQRVKKSTNPRVIFSIIFEKRGPKRHTDFKRHFQSKMKKKIKDEYRSRTMCGHNLIRFSEQKWSDRPRLLNRQLYFIKD